MDNNLFLRIYNFGQKNKGLYNIAFNIMQASALFFVAAYLFLLVFAFIYVKDKLILIMLVPFFCISVNKILRNIIKRKRPYLRNNIKLNFQREDKFSLPSNHACSAMIISLSYFMIFKSIGILLILCAFLTGFSRIVVGIHYPLDIGMGFFVAIIFSLIYVIII